MEMGFFCDDTLEREFFFFHSLCREVVAKEEICFYLLVCSQAKGFCVVRKEKEIFFLIHRVEEDKHHHEGGRSCIHEPNDLRLHSGNTFLLLEPSFWVCLPMMHARLAP